jgi:hypothetical protein
MLRRLYALMPRQYQIARQERYTARMLRLCCLLLLTLPLLADQKLEAWLTAERMRLLDARQATLSQLRTREDAEARRTHVRQELVRLLGGLPPVGAPLRVVKAGVLPRKGYRIEKLTYESLPGYRVAANVYVPNAAGRHPAVLFSIGHWEAGKPAAQTIAANLALQGFVVLAYDPVGQGERQQSYDARMGRSLAGGPTEQHFQAGPQALLAGHNFARYMIHDGRRGIDYLVSRPDVDKERIGATGCSGGGTQTTFIAALDDRVKVAAPACYMNSFRVLSRSTVGDSEQSWPGFLAAGLDQSDFILAFAPKPWLISSTEEDFFTPAGAKIVYDEGRSFYRHYGAEDKVAWVIGPGGHGTPLKVREAIYEWFHRWLHPNGPEPREQAIEAATEWQLQAANGNVAGRGISEVIAASAPRAGEDLVAWLNTLIRPLLPASYVPWRDAGPAPERAARRVIIRNGDYELNGWFHAGTTRTTEVLVFCSDPQRAGKMAHRGFNVLYVEPRGLPSPAETKLSGDWMPHTFAWLNGHNLPLLRATDMLAAMRSALLLPGIQQLRLYGSGVQGLLPLIAATQEPRVRRTWIDRTPTSLRAALTTPLTRDLHEMTIPGLLAHGDLTLLKTVRTVWSDPTDWMRNVRPAGPEFYYRAFEEDDEAIITRWLK